MKVNYHPETDSLYIDLSEQPSVESREISAGVVLDYDESGNLRNRHRQRKPQGRAPTVCCQPDPGPGRNRRLTPRWSGRASRRSPRTVVISRFQQRNDLLRPCANQPRARVGSCAHWTSSPDGRRYGEGDALDGETALVALIFDAWSHACAIFGTLASVE